MDNQKFDVIAVNIDTNRILWVDGPKTAANADAFIRMAIMRQGVGDRYFTTTLPGAFKAGDSYGI